MARRQDLRKLVNARPALGSKLDVWVCGRPGPMRRSGAGNDEVGKT